MGVQEMVQRWAGHRFVSVLLLHRVTDAIAPDSLTVSKAYFREMCRRLRQSFHVVPLSEIYRLINGPAPLPPRTLAITFDDSYQEDLDAARVLAEHGLPACFFLPTAYIGSKSPFDPSYPHLGNLTVEEVKELVRLGHEVGSHTVTHPDMAHVSLDQAEDELVRSKQILEEYVDRPVRWFAYPFGGPEHFLPRQLSLAFRAGYEGVLSGYGGFVHSGLTGQILPRIPVPCFPSLPNLELHLTGCLQWWYGLKRLVGMTKGQVSGIRHQESGVRHQGSGRLPSASASNR
jgi:peptidoglycan/xylan/chitin deacetylase (PgdA/CDA1 family)